MAKVRTVFVCADCGTSQPKWVGQCPSCKAWNTFTRLTVAGGGGAAGTERGSWLGAALPPARAQLLADVGMADVVRIPLGVGEFDRVLGGGVVPGSLILLGGEPGIGKSTLVLQAAARLGREAGPVLYVSGEESTQQIKLRAERMALEADGLYLLAETNLTAIMAEVERIQPRVLIVDSIQTSFAEDVESAAGSVTQVRECAARLMRLAKTAYVSVVLVGHVTKSGEIAGPRILEHMVDVVLYLEGDRFHSYRLLRSVKNRFGSTNEVGVFDMRGQGLVEIPNPSEVFLAERLTGVAGSCVNVTMEGSRPLLVEIQALVTESNAQIPRRSANGVDPNRLLLLTAVLGKRLGLPLANRDVFVNVVGGLKISEPAADLAVALAVVSSSQNAPVPSDLAIIGEIGLSGELRSVAQLERRLAEAEGLGFRRALVPQMGLKAQAYGELKVLGARTVGQALDLALAGES
ncbi:MAG: DNA repair protein RadA [Anaerolineae bacterium]|nr:DNA repair protein RadA [Anaerolineae bacterium]HRA20772.1 DNA repair protein RadA [Anaerolineae bacterium]